MSDEPKSLYDEAPNADWIVMRRQDAEVLLKNQKGCPPGTVPSRCLRQITRVLGEAKHLCRECKQTWSARNIYKLTDQEAKELGFNPSNYKNLKKRRQIGSEEVEGI